MRKILETLAAGFIVFLMFTHGAAAHDLDQVRKGIKEKGAHWTADETSVSVLTDQEKKHLVGHIKPKLTGAEPALGTGSGASAAYVSYDWSDPVKSYVTPVRNQSSCGSCWAFAATAALESYTLIKSNLPGQELNLSEQVLVSCSGAGSCGGGTIGGASNYIRDKGLPADGCFPYTATNNTCSAACYTYQSDSYKIQSWAYVATTSVSVEAIKNALVTYGPLVTTMDVYADFFNYRSGIYSYVTGAYQGGHAILLVGYDDANQCFKAKNSWGTGWGEGGYFRIAYSAIANPVYFGEYTIAYQGSSPAPAPPPAPAPAACTYTLSPLSKSFTEKGGKGSFSVTTQAGCGWSASTESPEWIGLSAKSAMTGSGTVSYTVVPNATTTTRTGAISVTSGSSAAAGSVSIFEKGRRR